MGIVHKIKKMLKVPAGTRYLYMCGADAANGKLHERAKSLKTHSMGWLNVTCPDCREEAGKD
jgi:hypothetical protein